VSCHGDLTGALLSALTGWDEAAVAVAAGVLFTLIAFVGIRAISWIGYISAPLFVVFGVAALFVAAGQRGGRTSPVTPAPPRRLVRYLSASGSRW
jgi:purine-cytosine permease-like protein